MPESPTPSRLVLLRDKLLHRFGRGGTVLLAVMLVLLINAIGFAIDAEKPWGRTVKKRLDKKEALESKEYAVIGLWWAAVADAGVLAVLLGTAGKWMPTPDRRSQITDSKAEEPKKSGSALIPEKWMLGLVLGAVVFGAIERWPRLPQSFWNDEAYSLKSFVHGTWKIPKNGTTATFDPVTWTDTLFENKNGNNHLLNSLVSRVSLDVWRAVTGTPREEFSETVARLPQFLAGLGTIFLLFLLGREIGSPLVGLTAAWLLAPHPWHMRYAVEMRGYSLMLFFLALSLLGLVRALRTDGVRWWLLFSMGEALYLLSFPGALYVAVAVNLLCAIELLRRRDWRTTGRLAAFNVLAAVPVIQWMLPSVPQILLWLGKKQPAYVTDIWQWLRDLVSVLAVGWQYDNPRQEAHVGTDWKGVVAGFRVMDAAPVPPVAVALFFAVLFIAGLGLAFRRGVAARLIVIAPVIAALVNLAVNLRPDAPMTVWYLFYLLIPATLAVPLALERAGHWRNLRWLPVVLCAWFVWRYSTGTELAASALREHSRQPMKETVASIRAQSPDAITATFGRSDRQHTVYDRNVAVLETIANLEAAIEKSRSLSKPLYIYFCSDDVYTRADPDADPNERLIYNRVAKSGEFEKVADFPGSEELWSYRVYRWRATNSTAGETKATTGN